MLLSYNNTVISLLVLTKDKERKLSSLFTLLSLLRAADISRIKTKLSGKGHWTLYHNYLPICYSQGCFQCNDLKFFLTYIYFQLPFKICYKDRIFMTNVVSNHYDRSWRQYCKGKRKINFQHCLQVRRKNNQNTQDLSIDKP